LRGYQIPRSYDFTELDYLVVYELEPFAFQRLPEVFFGLGGTMLFSSTPCTSRTPELSYSTITEPPCQLPQQLHDLGRNLKGGEAQR
jgi:hypothetical protein